MTRLITLLCVVFFASTTSAKDPRLDLQRPLGSGTRLVVTAAANVMGGFGTHFRSDVIITNFRGDADQVVSLQWLPRGGSGVALPPKMLNLRSNGGVASEDFVQFVMEQAGAGAILISGIGPADDVDPNAKIHAVSRIWSPQPGTNGTTGQSVPVLRLEEIESRRLTIMGHKLDSRYRTNVGIVNLDTGGPAQTFRITVSGTSPTGQFLPPEQLDDVQVSPLGTQQVPIPLTRDYGVLQIHVAIVPPPGGGTLTLWTAYASSVDNITGDAWTSAGFTAPPDEL